MLFAHGYRFTDGVFITKKFSGQCFGNGYGTFVADRIFFIPLNDRKSKDFEKFIAAVISILHKPLFVNLKEVFAFIVNLYDVRYFFKIAFDLFGQWSRSIIPGYYLVGAFDVYHHLVQPVNTLMK